VSARPHILQVGEELPPMDGPAPRRVATGDRTREANESAGGDRRRTANRFGDINAFLDATMAGLRPCERAVWLLLWRDTRPNGLARTSQADLARRAGASDRAVREALRELQRRGLVVVVRQGRLQSGPSCYRVRPLTGCD
jgi:hypothetical protein